MGKEARVIGEIGEWFGEGKLLLETEELTFRGARKLAIALTSITALSVDKGWLRIEYDGELARFDLGDAYAEKWMLAIRNPKTVIDKLDVKETSHVLFEGPVDPAFVDAVRKRAAVTYEADALSPNERDQDVANLDLIYYAVDDPERIRRIAELRPRIKSSGAIWVLHPRGRRELSHDAIMAVAKPVGLIDVKSARFNETHGALKLMVPRAQR